MSVVTAAGVPFRLHEYDHDPRHPSFGEEAVAALGVAAARVFKTLVVALDGDPRRLAVAVIPVPGQLALKRIAGALGARSAALAEVARAERATGYVSGGISPLGQRSRLPLALDDSAFAFETIYVSAGRRGLEIELEPGALLALTEGLRAELTAGG
ncbi:MAG TPA: aminoacyl-tRNA deacylase [Pseudomonadales bacterium]|nr:aminoacyl-tRNA deacylase [Pseudomonadales bacterium]